MSQSQASKLPFPSPAHFFWIIALLLLLYCIGSFVEIWKDSARRIYDVSVALQYVQILYDDLEDIRKVSTKLLVDTLNKGGKWSAVKDFEVVDDGLDVLDDIGFLVEGDQMSDVVAYHYFFHQVQLYYEACAEYIEEVQKDEPAEWEHIKPLYLILRGIEAHKSKEEDAAKITLGPKKLKEVLMKEFPAKQP